MSSKAGTTLAQRLLCLRLTSGVCVAGAVGAAICAATGGSAPSIIAISAFMTQAAAYGINRLSARADQTHADLAKQVDELTRGLRNADVHRLMGRAVSLVLRVHAHEPGEATGATASWPRLANAIDARWTGLESGTLPEALQEVHVSAYFDHAPEEIKAQPVLDADLWREVLEPIAREGGVTPSNDEWRSIGVALAAKYPRALYAVTKSAASENDPAWTGLLLRLLAEQRAVMDFAASEAGHARRQAERNTEHLHDIKDDLDGMKDALAQLGDLGATRMEAMLIDAEKRDDARARGLRTLVQSEGKRMREGLSFVWTLAGRSEDHMLAALSKLDAIASLADRLPEMDRALSEVAQGVAALQRGTLTVASMKARNNLAAARVVANRFFTGRADDLARVRAALTADGGSLVHALGGEGGIGKSELAKAYALIFACEYDGVWWIDAAAHALPTALARVYELATGRPPPEKATPAQVAQLLADHWSKERPLIILDNVDDPEHFTLLGPLAHGHVLATTRDLVRTHAGVKVLRVDVLPVPDAVGLLRKEIGDHRAMPSEVDLATIAEELGGHALAVALAGAYLASSPDVSTAETLAKIREGGRGEAEVREEGERRDPLGLKYRHSVAASLSLHFDRPEVIAALPLLASAAYLHPVGMPLDLLAAGAGWTVDQARKAARVLDRASIVRLGETVSVHRLTQAVARSREDVAGGDKAAAIVDRLIHAMSSHYANGENLSDTNRLNVPVVHAEAILSFADSVSFRPRHAICAARLRSHLASHLVTVGDYDHARAHIDTSISWYESREAPNQRELAIRYEVRAKVREAQCEFMGAQADIQKSIEWGESQSPIDSHRLARWYELRASIRHISGDLEAAESDIRRSIQYANDVPRTDAGPNASAYAMWGLILQDLGDLSEAEANTNEYLGRVGPDKSCMSEDWAASVATRARIRQLRGNLVGAEEDIIRCIAWANTMVQADRRMYYTWLRMRGRIRHLRGQLADAAQDMRSAIAWELSQPEPIRVELALRRASLGRILADQGFADAGLELNQEALAWACSQNPQYAWGIALWSGERATILLELGRVKEAIADITKCIVWHREHQPRARFRMAHFLRWQSRILAAAEEWDKAAASIGEAIPLHESEFGAEHEWTARARRTLEAIIARQLPER